MAGPPDISDKAPGIQHHNKSFRYQIHPGSKQWNQVKKKE